MKSPSIPYALLLLTALAAPAQQPFSQLSASDLTRAYIQHVSTAPDQSQRYTYLVLHHDQNFVHGKLTSDQTYQSELTYIAGLPYTHRLEHNGKPLQGKELPQEDELYNRTVKERTGLTDDLRRALLHAKSRTVQTFSNDHLLADFHPEITGHPTFDGHPAILLDLTPIDPNAPPSLQRHIILTLDAANLNLLQSRVEFLAPDGGCSQGTLIIDHLTYLDGTPLPAETSVDTTIQAKHLLLTEAIHLISTDTFSNYRRFTTTVTLRSTPDTDTVPPPN
jgi:hypothetical protein